MAFGHIKIDDILLAVFGAGISSLGVGTLEYHQQKKEFEDRLLNMVEPLISAVEGLREIDVGSIEGTNKPADLPVTMHICRGNFRSTWFSSGGYEPVAAILFSHCNVDGFFLEYDSDRSGSFEPLRFIKNQTVVLGLITSKFPELEDKDAVKARIEEATKYVPLNQLCLSPQCGFSSTEEGNIMTEDEQWAKVRLVREIADEVWGDQ